MADNEEEEVGETEKVQETEDQEEAAPAGESAEPEEGGDGEDDADKGDDDFNQKDVFGEDSDDEEEPQPKKKSRLRQANSDDSDDDEKPRSDKEDKSEGEGRGSGSDNEDSSPRKKKDKKKKERKKKRGRDEKEGKPKKRAKRNRDDGSDGDGSGGEASKEKRVFEESDDDAEERDEGIDLETGEVVASKPKSNQISKKAKREMRARELARIQDFVKRLKNAALADRNAFKEKRMATTKMEMLHELQTELSRGRTQQDYLENGVLKSLKLWLDPLDHEAKSFRARASSLPNRKLMAATLELILNLQMEGIKKATEKGGEHTLNDNMGLVEESEIARAVRFVQNALQDDGKDTEAYKNATKVRQKWSRIIFKKSASYKKSADQMDGDDDVGPMNLPKANREWEKMPESRTSKGLKAVKGDYGFRYGASVPRPMLVDFVKQPETKIIQNGREMDLEEVLDRAKESSNETRSRLSKIGVETVRGNAEGKNMRAKAPELNRMHVGGVADKVTSMGWTDRAKKK